MGCTIYIYTIVIYVILQCQGRFVLVGGINQSSVEGCDVGNVERGWASLDDLNVDVGAYSAPPIDMLRLMTALMTTKQKEEGPSPSIILVYSQINFRIFDRPTLYIYIPYPPIPKTHCSDVREYRNEL
jgi:hypothetical protein